MRDLLPGIGFFTNSYARCIYFQIIQYWLKLNKNYKIFQTIIEQSGFSWDEERQLPTAPDDLHWSNNSISILFTIIFKEKMLDEENLEEESFTDINWIIKANTIKICS